MIGILVASIQIQTIQAALVTSTMPPAALECPRATFWRPSVIVLVYCREQVAIFNCKGIAAIPSWNHNNNHYVLTRTSLANHKDNFFFNFRDWNLRKTNKQTTQQLLWVLEWNHIMWPFKLKAAEEYLPVVLFIMLYKVILTFESVDEILWCNHSNESYWAVLSCGTVYYAVQGGSNFWVCGWKPMVWPFQWKLLSSTFLWYCLLCCKTWF